MDGARRPGLGRRFLQLRGLPSRQERPAYARLYEGQDALERLLSIGEPQAETLLSLCAAALSLYPAWERQSWVMPEPEVALQVHGGQFLDLGSLALRLGGVRHILGRHGYLHAPSGLAFAAHRSDADEVTLILGGTNSSHTDSQPGTLQAEVQQLRADVSNVVGRVPRLYRTADLVTLTLRDELAREVGGRLVRLTGHSLGGGLAQYAGLMNTVPVLAFSPVALGKGVLALLRDAGLLDDPAAVTARMKAYSLQGDPVPGFGTGWLQTNVVGEHLRLPLSPEVPAGRYATSHGQIYSHLVAHLKAHYPELPNAIERKARTGSEPGL
ncbi:hypothetical protein [Deinococcus altitudinis]|uniref:hypothetical protein n=1 Tax=Deinococcus altitudinis TaxID=468914 RepID=UPI0038927520